MDKISDYNCLNDFWLDLTVFTDKLWLDSDSLRLPQHFSEHRNGGSGQRRMFTVENSEGTLITRLNTSYRNVNSLRVSQRIDRLHGFGATTIALILESSSRKNSYVTVGSLVMSGYPLLNKPGLRIVNILDIPEDRQAVIDIGVAQLLG